MNDEEDPSTSREIIVESSRAVARAESDSRGLSRPSLPKTRKLAEPRDIIAVDLEERMDEAAAVEAADPRTDNLWLKAVRSGIVGVTAALAWWLLPHESPPRPPIKLPESLQAEIDSTSPAQAAAENQAIKVFTEDGPEDSLDDLRACLTPGPASHRAWRTFLTALAQRGHDDELLTQARAYADKFPDRLEAAHFMTEAMLRQDIDAHRKGFFNTVTADFKAELQSTQKQLSHAIALLGDHENDWPYKARIAWQDALLVDSALLSQKQWRCEETPFEHEHRDNALAALERIASKDARNVLQLKRDIYAGIRATWPRLTWQTRINGETCSKGDVGKFIEALDDKLKASQHGE